MQTKDYRELPGGYGMGSSTLAQWIQGKMDEDAAFEVRRAERNAMIAAAQAKE